MQVVIIVVLLAMACFAVSRVMGLATNDFSREHAPLMHATSLVYWSLVAGFALFFGVGGPISIVLFRMREAAEHRKASRRRRKQEQDQSRRIQIWEDARSRIVRKGPRSLADAEVAGAQAIVTQGTSDALQLAATAIESADVRPADISAIFTSDVLKCLAESAAPECWPRAVACFQSVEPCLGLFAEHLSRSLPSLIDGVPGCCRQVDSRTRPYQCYRTLLEHEFPQSLMDQVEATLLERLAAQWPGYEGQGSPPHTVYAFAGRELTRLSRSGARVLAALPVSGGSPDFGAYLLLSRLTELDDEVAGLMANARRSLLFGRLRTFPATPGHIALANRLAMQDKVVLGPKACVAPLVDLILTNKVTTVLLSESDVELSELIGNNTYPPS